MPWDTVGIAMPRNPDPLPSPAVSHRARLLADRTTARRWLLSVAASGAFLLLLGVAIEVTAGWLVVVVVASVLVTVGTFLAVFPGSRFFTIALADFIGIYACVFVFVADANFPNTHPWVPHVGFVMPLVAFLAGALVRRDAIRAVLAREELKPDVRIGHPFRWLVPILGVLMATFTVPTQEIDPRTADVFFLGAMALTSLVVFRASQEVALLLLDTGLLFEEFFEQVADLVQPAFAFLTFYSVLVIVFGALYTVIDRVSTQPHFVIAGAGGRDITFPEALYFSLVTLATVGYGDIVPGSNLIRVLSSVEVVAGILLLLFGFNAILTYATQRRPPGRR